MKAEMGSTDLERPKVAFDKVECSFIKKFWNKLGIERANLYLVKVIYDKPILNIILNGGKI